MGCIGGFYKNYDKCLYYLKQYNTLISTKNYNEKTEQEKFVIISNSNFYKKKINETLQKMNKEAKYRSQSKQLIELNEIYQNFLSKESYRNKTQEINDNNAQPKVNNFLNLN